MNSTNRPGKPGLFLWPYPFDRMRFVLDKQGRNFNGIFKENHGTSASSPRSDHANLWRHAAA
ncbi:hypothetical protein DEA98_00475 [Brucella pseudogrignonensis]|nr:hypothetical protein [Brucella pseudogrignonensis]